MAEDDEPAAFDDEGDDEGDEPDDIDEELVAVEIDEDLVGEDGLETPAVVADDDEEEDDDAAAGPKRPAVPATGGDDDEEEPDPDDVEADLDTILKDRIAASDDEEDEEEEEQPPGRAGTDTEDGGGRVAPRKAGEFVCSSCFLVKPNSQLADGKRKLCLDCV